MSNFYLGSTALNKALLGNTQVNEINLGSLYIIATGGTITYDGDYKIHTFTGAGTSSFNVTSTGTGPFNTIEYLVLGGGSGGGGGQVNDNNGAGGAGGTLRSGSYTLTLSDVGSNNVVVGFGTSGSNTETSTLPAGTSSIFNISASGGEGVSYPQPRGAANADFAGGLGYNMPGGSQGGAAGGGAGAGAVGGNSGATVENDGGNGGDGKLSAISGTPTYYGGGGGGCKGTIPGLGTGVLGTGGAGGGGNANYNGNGFSATANRGAGGGAAGPPSSPGSGPVGGNGSNGIVILRYKFQ